MKVGDNERGAGFAGRVQGRWAIGESNDFVAFGDGNLFHHATHGGTAVDHKDGRSHLLHPFPTQPTLTKDLRTVKENAEFDQARVSRWSDRKLADVFIILLESGRHAKHVIHHRAGA